ncbi:MAG: tetratricopeptide repeat protein [Acidobacteria bacterium]|nr:tetratricopeptide repeat protein [Acidobacteriota bacterium]
MICLWLIVLQTPPQMPDLAALLKDANAAYQAGSFEDAKDAYEQIYQAGIQNEVLFYNLGNAYFQLGKIGKAILFYYRAQRWDPLNPDIRDNLILAMNQRLDPPIEEEQLDPFRYLKAAMLWVPYPVLFWLASVLLGVGGVLGLRSVIVRGLSRRSGYALVLCVLLGFFVSFMAFAQYRHLTRADLAVVTAHEVDILAGPSKREGVSFTLHEGMRCQILDESGDYFRIRLANGYNGWIPKSRLEII